MNDEKYEGLQRTRPFQMQSGLIPHFGYVCARCEVLR